jgi:hypothetical protein
MAAPVPEIMDDGSMSVVVWYIAQPTQQNVNVCVLLLSEDL